MDVFHGEGPALLVRAILALETEEECRAFLEDLMTGREIQDLQRHHQPGQPVLYLRRRGLPDRAGPAGGGRSQE